MSEPLPPLHPGTLCISIRSFDFNKLQLQGRGWVEQTQNKVWIGNPVYRHQHLHGIPGQERWTQTQLVSIVTALSTLPVSTPWPGFKPNAGGAVGGMAPAINFDWIQALSSTTRSNHLSWTLPHSPELNQRFHSTTGSSLKPQRFPALDSFLKVNFRAGVLPQTVQMLPLTKYY